MLVVNLPTLTVIHLEVLQIDKSTVVHPWLIGLREDILQAKAIARPLAYGETVNTTEWMVDYLLGPGHEIMTKESWVEKHRGPRLNVSAKATFLQRIGAQIAQ